jgi:trimeric autotransporter adhesin
MCSRKWLIVALVACGLASACSEFNTNLSIQTSSSTLEFLSPQTATAGGGGFTITADGTGFVSGAILLWEANSATPISLNTTYVDPNHLTAPIPASYLATPGTIQIAVDIPGSSVSGSSSTTATTTTEISNIVFFTIGNATGTTPAITALSSSTTSQASTPYCGAAGITLTVTGTNLTSDAIVNWNGLPRATTFVNSTQVTASILPTDTAFPGPVNVTVSNSVGNSNSLPFTLSSPTTLAAPGIASLSQSSIAAGSPALSLTVTGSNILPCSVVQWVSGSNPPAALTTTYVSGTQLTATVPATDFQALGNAQVAVFTIGPGGGTTQTSPAPAAATFTIVPPSVTSLSSSVTSTSSAPSCGMTSFTLAVTGTNFVNGSVVNWNGSPRATTFVSSTLLTATITAADTASQGTAQVSVSNLTVTSNTLPFTTSAPSAALPVPAIGTLSPATVTAGTGAFTLSVTGSNFVPCSLVQWNGVSRTTTYISPTQLTAAILTTDVASVGSPTVTVFNTTSGGGGGASGGVALMVVAPAITSLSASTTGSASTAYCSPIGLTLTVNGTGFASGVVVNWNGSPRSTTFVSATQVTAAITSADTAAVGTVNITVSSSPTVISNSMPFTMVTPDTLTPPTTLTAPSITSLTPASADSGAAGFLLTVNDDQNSSLLPCSVVQWNGSARTTTFVGVTGLNASISAADVANPGMIPVTVFTPGPGGGTSNAITFTVYGPPFPAERKAAVENVGQAANADSGSSDPLSLPLTSAAGRYAAFVLASIDGVTETPGAPENIFVRDTCTGAPAGCTPSLLLASIGFTGNPADGNSISPSISADGRYVTFISSATNLVDGDTNGLADVFVRDTCAGAESGCTPSTQRVSVASDGTQANGESTSATIGADGRYITFFSSATNLGGSVSSSASGIFLRDTCEGAGTDCTPSTQQLQ